MAKETKLDTREFDASFRLMMRYTKRDLATALNTSGFYIARRATIETPRTTAQEIKSSLGRIIKRKDGRRTLRLTKADRHPFSLAEAILRARAKRRGDPQPTKDEIGPMIEMLVASRNRSRAFIASGWIPSIKAFERLADRAGRAPRKDRQSKQYGAPKGRGIPARPGFRVRAILENASSTKRDTKQALLKYGLPALQRAFAFETANIRTYLARKMNKTAREIGILTR